MQRILDAILFLAKQNLAFRNHNEHIDGDNNPGNFWKLLKLISKYDATMREHLIKISLSEKPTLSYLSPDIQHEFISLLASHVT